jgi:cell division protein ZapA
MSTPTLAIKLLGKEYRVACADEDREALQAAVALLDERLGETAAKNKSTGERLAVLTALNLAHELLLRQDHGVNMVSPIDSRDLKRRIGVMEARLDEALAQQEDLF